MSELGEPSCHAVPSARCAGDPQTHSPRTQERSHDAHSPVYHREATRRENARGTASYSGSRGSTDAGFILQAPEKLTRALLGSVTQAWSAHLGLKCPPLSPVSPPQPLPCSHPSLGSFSPDPGLCTAAAHPSCQRRLQDRGLELLPRQPGPRARGEWRPCQHQGPGAPMSPQSHTHSRDPTLPAPRVFPPFFG